MTVQKYVKEPILVQARFLTDGGIQPTAFIWEGRTRYVASQGRQWEEEADGVYWHCYLVMTPTSETFDLRLDKASSRWFLWRAWLRKPQA